METSPTQGTSNTAANNVEPTSIQGDNPSQREEEAVQALKEWANAPQSGRGKRSVVEMRILGARESGSHNLELNSLGIESLPPHLDILLPKVKTLDLSQNNLTLLPDTLPPVEALNISDNPLKTLPSEWPGALKKLNFSPDPENLLRVHAQKLLEKDVFRNVKLSNGEPSSSQQKTNTHTHQLESFVNRRNPVITSQPTSSAQQDIDPETQEMLRILTLLHELHNARGNSAQMPRQPVPESSCCMRFMACLVLCCTYCCCLPCICVALLRQRKGYTPV